MARAPLWSIIRRAGQAPSRFRPLSSNGRAHKRGPDQLAARFIELIGRLYHVEAQARRDKLDEQALLRRRQQHSKPVLDQIKELALQHLNGVLPGSLLGKALYYVTAQWPKLERYVQDGRYPIDNNDCENAIRPFVIG